MGLNVLIFLIFSTSAFSKVISEDITNLAGFMAISTMDAKLLEDAKKSVECEDEVEPPAPPSAITVSKPESAFKVTVHYSVGLGSAGGAKEFVDSSKIANQGILNQLINGSFESYEDRRKAISQACNGTSEMEKLALASELGKRLSQIYDYDRQYGGSKANETVTPEEQWNALKSSTSKGVCRDAALTLSQFLISCGMPKERIGIQAYQTILSSHQVISVLGSDGKTYTLNWGEVFSQKENGIYQSGPQPSIVNTDLFQHTYDPETGKIIDRRRNELGDIMKRVTGGKLDNKPLPDLLMVELAHGGLAGNFFEAKTGNGDSVKGVAVNYKGQSHTGEWLMNLGIAFAKNEREFQKNSIEYSNLEQELVYVQGEVSYSPNFSYQFSDGDKVTLSPALGVEMDAYMSKNHEGDKEGKNQSSILTSKAEIIAEAQGQNLSMWGKSKLYLDHITYQHNTEKSGSSESGILSSTSYAVGTGYRNEAFSVSTSAEIIISKTETSKHLYVSASNRKQGLHGRIIYSMYDRKNGTRSDYVKVEAGKTWKFEKVGTVEVTLGLQKSLLEDSKDTAMAINASWRPD